MRIDLPSIAKYTVMLHQAERCPIHGRIYLYVCSECEEIKCFMCDGSCQCTNDE